MKLKKDNVIRTLTNEATIKIFKDNGWEEVKEQPKEDKKVEVKVNNKKNDK